MAEEFVILIREPQWDAASATEADWADMMKAHGAFAQAVAAAGGQVLGGDALEPTSQAVRITPARNEHPAVYTDGPFTELKEVVSGFYKISVKDAAEARELAALVPTGGWVELYPVMNTDPS